MTISEKLNSYERVYIQVDLDAIKENVQNMKANIAPETKMMAVIKTDGYGHGAVPIAQVLEDYDYIFGYAVATPEEAMALRVANITKPILILGYTFPYAYDSMALQQIRPAVFREDSLPLLNQSAKKCQTKMKVHIKVDTGMGRIGITPDVYGIEFIKKVLSYDHLEIEGIFTHFANADVADKTNVNAQLKRFSDFVEQVEQTLKITIPIKHCANSAAIMELPNANKNLVRAGITLYGLYPSDEVDKNTVSLRPALSLFSKIVFVKEIHEGQGISYGSTYIAKEDRKVATIPVGYGDGYPRSLSNKGHVLIRGKKAPILGRVCMDQFMVDVTDIPDVKEGDVVTLLGRDGEEQITAEYLGDLSVRFNYELVCDLGKRIPRAFMENGKIKCVKDYFGNYY